jgi:hypothetical protein
MPATSLPPGAERKLLNKLRELLTLGYSEDDIAAELGVRISTYQQLKRTLIEFEVRDILKKPSTQVFIEYSIAQENCLKDIIGILKQSAAKNNPAIGVQAVRLKSEIYDKVLGRGVELGVISKDRHLLPDEAAMGDKELQKLAEAEIDHLQALIKDIKVQKSRKVQRHKKLSSSSEEMAEELKENPELLPETPPDGGEIESVKDGEEADGE